MLDVPLDAVYYWLGLSIVSLAVVGVATTLPTQPPPDATAAANTVDAIAASDYQGTAEHPLSAASVRLTPSAIGLRTDAGTTHATFAFGPVTPVAPGSSLAAVARGAPPDQHFDDPSAFATAAERARTASKTGTAPMAGSVPTTDSMALENRVATTDSMALDGGLGTDDGSTRSSVGIASAWSWRSAPDVLVVRQVNWGDVSVTLVLA